MSDTLNVLVVVDVQNCFMYSDDKKNTFLNLSDLNESINMANEIADLSTKNELVVFTRDFHPLNHVSFGDGTEGRETVPIEGTWPIHCRDQLHKCSDRIDGKAIKNVNENINTDDSNIVNTTKLLPYIEDKIKTNNNTSFFQQIRNFLKENTTQVLPENIYGTELSYLFYGTPLKNIISQLNIGNKSGFYKIKDTDNEYPKNNDDKSVVNLGNVLKENGKEYVVLTKGKECDKESYSAFNYHLQYTYSPETISKPTQSKIPVSESESTGLWEFILEKSKEKNKTKIQITVCGLVGNVCVMYSVLEGIALWNDFYSKKTENSDYLVHFIYSLRGNRFTTAVPPSVMKPTQERLMQSTDGTLIPWMNLKNPTFEDGSSYTISFNKTNVDFQNEITGFNFYDYNDSTIIPNYSYSITKIRPQSQTGGKKYKKCPKCKKNPLHGGKCFVCGFIPFLGKTKTQKRKSRRGKKTRKNKRRFSRKTRR